MSVTQASPQHVATAPANFFLPSHRVASPEPLHEAVEDFQQEIDMGESEFWVKVWKIVAATVVALVVTVAGCTAHQISTIERMTAAGANPLDAKCAVSGTEGKECILRFAQSK